MEQIRLDIVPKGIMPVCHSSQYDSGRVIRLNLMDGLQGYSLTDETIELDVRKPDGHIVTSPVDVVEGNTYVDIVTTEQMCAVEGENICELKISKDGAEIYSLNFKMKVEKSVLEGGDPSESFVYNLNEQIAEAVEGQYEGDVIFDDEPTENHGIPYAVTSEGIKAYVDDATPDNLSDLSDVNISSPTSNQALVWDSVNNEWTNGEVSTVGNLDDLSDVSTSGKTSGDNLRYDGNSWIAQPNTIALTQAEYDALQTKEENTHYVITDGYNLNPTASDIEYSSGVSVKDKIDTKADKTVTVGSFTGANNMNIIRSTVVKYGDLKILSVIFQPRGTSVNLGDVSNGFQPLYNIDFSAVSDNGYGARMRLAENTQTVVFTSSEEIQSYEYYAFTICYI